MTQLVVAGGLLSLAVGLAWAATNSASTNYDGQVAAGSSTASSPMRSRPSWLSSLPGEAGAGAGARS